MNGCSDRRLIVYSIATLGLSALLAAAVLGAIVIMRLADGADMPPGVAAFLAGLVLIATNSGSLLAPSPLSKTSGASDEPMPVTGPDGGPVAVKETRRG